MSQNRYMPKHQSSSPPKLSLVSIHYEHIPEENTLLIEESSFLKTPEDFFAYNFGYNVVRDSTQHMTREIPGWAIPATFFEKKPGVGSCH
jgi:hypothetical protein